MHQEDSRGDAPLCVWHANRLDYYGPACMVVQYELPGVVNWQNCTPATSDDTCDSYEGSLVWFSATSTLRLSASIGTGRRLYTGENADRHGEVSQSVGLSSPGE